MKKFLKWPLILAIILVAIILYWAMNAEWLDLKRKTYENARYDFSLKYPENWILGEPEMNNAGRELYSPEREVFCYAYGFANALQNEKGEPQTLDEFIDWLLEGETGEVLKKENSTFSGKDAVRFLTEEEGNVKEAIYALGKETGIGFYCIYPDLDTLNRYTKEFEMIMRSFQIKGNLDGEEFISGMEDCTNLLNGVALPFKDLQIFTDENYTEVTMISRESWNKSKLPSRVIDLENKDYTCYPMPLEMEDTQSGGGIHAQPEVTKVEWSCELLYDDYEYLEIGDMSGKEAAEKNGFICKKETCLGEGPEEEHVWLCSK